MSASPRRRATPSPRSPVLDVLIPGMKRLRLRHLVLDFNGTLACDGRLHRGVVAKLNSLRRTLALEVLTGDTFGTAGPALRVLAIPFLYINFKIVRQDLESQTISNKYLKYLLFLIPFFYVYLF